MNKKAFLTCIGIGATATIIAGGIYLMDKFSKEVDDKETEKIDECKTYKLLEEETAK
ncbi:hypothetical protein [Alkaliphilus sp. B6464]|uniref:hypothetical protein n=1 Tax=Alkaliphilus sp. B6464 TaxID=2731219 RepID=UPI001BAD3265|nr:hypothetical protein [Alkaliphilus sp. B6464]QUH22170.1 hypothetical protein HYG84_19880 [Alkaliphilus sp. B6464]